MRGHKNKINDMMSSVERKSERFINSFADLDPVTSVTQWFAGVMREGVGVSPQPKKVLKEMLRQARVSLIDWGGKFQCVDRYDVLVSQEAWSAYYGFNTSLICRGLAELHSKQITEHLRCSIDVEVRIAVDPTLDPGDFYVKAGYREAGDEGASAPSATGTARGGCRCGRDDDGTASTVAMEDRPGASAQGGTPSRAGSESTPACDVADAGTCGDAHTPSLAAQGATVSYCGASFPVEDGSTIGVMRQGSGSQASIALRYVDDLHFVSRVHGCFSYDASTDAWSFRQESPNGSTLRRGGKNTSLDQGDEVTLEDGDQLFMARAKQPVTFRREGVR